MSKSFWDDLVTPSSTDAAIEDTPTSTLDIITELMGITSEVPDSLPEELIPRHHTVPAWNDPTMHFHDLMEIFGHGLELTNPNEGIRSQKVNLNLSEIADAICRHYEFMSIAGRLAVYQSPCWRLMKKDEANHFIARAVRKLFPTDSNYLSDQQHREVLSRVLHNDRTEHLKAIPTSNYNYLACRDYLYDWRTGECVPHTSAGHRFAVLNLDAEDIGRCDGTHWEMFLDDLTGGDDALRQRVLEVIGVIISGYPSKSFFLLEGESGTGKSQLVNVLRDMLGEDACFALNDISQLGDRFTTGSIFGKLLCLCGDVPDAPLSSKAIGTIKQLTGDDLIRGESKYKDAFTFENTAKLLFVSNYPLQIPNENQEDALLDRLVVIPCLNPVPKERQIPGLHRILHEESGYIVHLAMEALIDLETRNGAFTSLSESLDFDVVQVPDDEQALLDFVRNCCQLGAGFTSTVNEMFQAFHGYSPDTTVDVTKFSKMLCRLFPDVTRSRTSKLRNYKGIQLLKD